jgi:DNA-binding ferritin-like protein
MVGNVLEDFEGLNGHLRSLVSAASGDEDAATANLLDGFADGQEKTAWMLRSFLAD